jgi:hypothetical protein
MQGPVGMSLSVNNPTATRGGSDQSSRSPTEQDYLTLHDKLLATLKTSAVEEIRARLKPGQHLLEMTIRPRSILSEAREPVIGQPGDQIQLALQVEFEGMTVEESDLQAVARSALDANKEKGFIPEPGSLQIAFASEPQLGTSSGSTQPIAEGGYNPARWSLNIERALGASMEKTAIIRSIQGRTMDEAQKTLAANLKLAEAPQIRLFPEWWGRLPFLPIRIKMVTEW